MRKGGTNADKGKVHRAQYRREKKEVKFFTVFQHAIFYVRDEKDLY